MDPQLSPLDALLVDVDPQLSPLDALLVIARFYWSTAKDQIYTRLTSRLCTSFWRRPKMKISKFPLGHSSLPPSTLPRRLVPLLSHKTFLDAYQPQVRNSKVITIATKNAAANLYGFQNEINGFRDDRISEKLKDLGMIRAERLVYSFPPRTARRPLKNRQTS